MARNQVHAGDTIAAIATAMGVGGIAVIRLSGPEAVKVASQGFQSTQTLERAPTHTVHVGRLADSEGKEIDEVVVTVYRQPRSYTGEDVVEVSCHGGAFVARKVLDVLLEYGARPADPGEFTKRAFLNGRIDLAQAEAVADLISARSDMAHRASLDQLSGGISRRIVSLRDSLVSLLGLLELELDFIEEHIELVDKKAIEQKVVEAIGEIDSMIQSYSQGKMVREGIRVVLAGSPNVGKSSVLNALLEEERAIVTEIPGTTRDVIEEGVTIDGLHFVLSDTAGVRAAVDLVEQHGVKRTETKVRNCDILLLVLDGSRETTDQETGSIERVVGQVKKSSSECIVVINKSDLPGRSRDTPRITQILGEFPNVRISAKTGSGMTELHAALVAAAQKGKMETTESGSLITNARHKEALARARESLGLSLDALKTEKSAEFVVVDLRAGLDSLGEIVGLTTTDDILDSIFSKFCIGK
jgi:tRNA modification GTPase